MARAVQGWELGRCWACADSAIIHNRSNEACTTGVEEIGSGIDKSHTMLATGDHVLDYD